MRRVRFSALMGAFDTILMGRKTYEATRQYGGSGMPGTRAYVVSRTLRQEDCPGVTMSEELEKTVKELKTGSGKDIWLFGGGGLFRSLLELRLVDSVELAVIPVLLGGGLPFLPNLAKPTKLTLKNHRVYPKTGTVSLEYALS